MFSRFTVLFDACVLYQAPVRDLVIELGIADLYRAKWSQYMSNNVLGKIGIYF